MFTLHYLRILVGWNVYDNTWSDLKFLLMYWRSVYVLQSMLNLFFYISDFGDVLLSGFRALSEQRPIAEDYSNFK